MRALSWIIAIFTLAGSMLGVVAWAYSTFEPKDASQEIRGMIIQRLDRIENKVDQLIKEDK